jgi:hypothetical protein
MTLAQAEMIHPDNVAGMESNLDEFPPSSSHNVMVPQECSEPA